MSTLIPLGLKPAKKTLDRPHPLEPLTAEEVRTAVDLLTREGKVTPSTRFVSVSLHEPDKAVVHHPDEGQATPPREAFAVLFDKRPERLFRGHAVALRGPAPVLDARPPASSRR